MKRGSGGGGRLFEAGRLFKVGVNPRFFFWTLIRINTVISTDIEIILEEFVSQFFFSVCFYNNDYTQQGLIRTPEDVLMLHPLPDRLGLEKNKTRAHVIHKRSLAPQKTLRRAMQDEKRSAGWCGVQGIF